MLPEEICTDDGQETHKKEETTSFFCSAEHVMTCKVLQVGVFCGLCSVFCGLLSM